MVAPNRKRRPTVFDGSTVLLAVAAGTVVLLIIVPLLALVREAFTGEQGELTLTNFISVFSEPRLRRSMINTVGLAFLVALFSSLIAVPLAFGCARTSMPFKRTLRAVAFLSIISPGFLIALAYVLLLRPNSGIINRALRELFQLQSDFGPLNIYSSMGFVLLTVPTGIGLCFLQLTPAFQNLDASMEAASM